MEPVVIVSFHARAEPSGWVDDLADSLLGEHLAAGVSVVGDVTSRYWWKGEVNHTAEVLVEITTREGLVGKVTESVLDAHLYELPGVRAVALDDVNHHYHQWVLDNTAGELT